MKKISLFLALLFLFLLPLTVQAADCSVTLQTEPGLAGAEFELFQLGGIFETPDEAYAHVLQAGLKPVAAGKLDARGKLTFDGLAKGQYLLVGKTLQVGEGRICRFDKSLLGLPGADGEIHLTVEPKYETEDISGVYTYRVLKLWDDDQSKKRPDSVQVELYRNGELSKTVTLNKGNRWQYQWEEVDPAADWAVAELVPDHYRAEYQRSGDTFVVCNILDTGVIPSIPTTPTDPTETTEGTEPTETTETTDPTTEPTEPGKPTLPQTGQLWWPVPVMAFAGTALFALGWLRRKESGDEG